MKNLSLTLITLVIFSAIKGLAQERPAHHTNTQCIDQLSTTTESINPNSDSTSLAAIAKLPLNKIHFENKGVRQAMNARWEDSFSKEENMNPPIDTLILDYEYVTLKIKEAPYLGHSEIFKYLNIFTKPS